MGITFIGITDVGDKVRRTLKKEYGDSLDYTFVIINNPQDIEELKRDGDSSDESVVCLIADLGNPKENRLAIEAVRTIKANGYTLACILATPYLYEGEKVIREALQTASEIGKMADAVLIMNKESDKEPGSPISFSQLLLKLTSLEVNIAGILDDLMVLVSAPTATGFNISDLKEALKESGTWTITEDYGVGNNRVMDALHSALYSIGLKKCDHPSPRHILIKLLASAKYPIRAEELKGIDSIIANLSNRVDIKLGTGITDNPEDLVTAIIFASGFDVKLH